MPKNTDTVIVPKQVEYSIVANQDIKGFHENVNKLISDGWQLIGDLHIRPDNTFVREFIK